MYMDMTVDVLDIGKADCTIFQHKDYCIMIDSGEKEDADKIIEFLDDKEIETIDLLVITHYDKDHVGGAPKLLKEKKVKEIFIPDYKSEKKGYQKFWEALKKYHYSKHRIHFIDKLKALKYGKMQLIVAPSGFKINKNEDKPDNNMSLVTLIKYGDIKMLWTGDLEKKGIQSWLTSRQAKFAHTINIIKMPHHGRYEEKIEDLLEWTLPDSAITCCKHDLEDETADALEYYNVKSLKTSDGHIHIETDGQRNLIIQQRKAFS